MVISASRNLITFTPNLPPILGAGTEAFICLSKNDNRLVQGKLIVILNNCLSKQLVYLQVTCQDISTMIRQNQRNIIFLINNGGYTIEVEIHDGPYNVIKNWDYCALVDAIKNGEGKVWTTRVSITAYGHLISIKKTINIMRNGQIFVFL